MADGRWTGVGASERLSQAEFMRHRLLAVNTSAAGTRAADGTDASSFASVDPNTLSPPPFGATPLPEGGPHFIMSPEAPSGFKTMGFGWGILDATVVHQDPAIRAQFAATGVDVVCWVLIETTVFPNGGDNPQWASFATLTGVQPGQYYRSFDIDAGAIRFQIGPNGITVDGVVIMFFTEL